MSDRYSFIFNLDDKLFIPVKNSSRAIAGHPNNGPTYGNGDLVVFSKFNEPNHLRSMAKEPVYNIPEINGKNLLTTRSNQQRSSISDLEIWQVTFTPEYQNEYCMQWIDRKFANENEMLTRRKRDEWESENVIAGQGRLPC